MLKKCFLLCIFIIITPTQSNDFIWRGSLISSVIAYFNANPFDSEFLGLESGYHTERDIFALKLLTSWGEKENFIKSKNYQLDIHHKINIGYWHLGLFSNKGDGYSGHNRTNTVLESMFTFRHKIQSLPFIIETNSGVALSSVKQLGTVRYGSNLGFVNGFSLIKAGKKWHYTFRYLHYSNNDIAKPNPPDNFVYWGIERQW